MPICYQSLTEAMISRVRNQKYILTGILTLLVLIVGYVNFMFINSENDKFSNTEKPADKDYPFFSGCVDTLTYLSDHTYKKQNATFIMLTRNEELEGVIKTLYSIERHFNQWFLYPYIFLNNEPFSNTFKETILSMTNAEVKFGLVDNWDFENKDELLVDQAIQDQGDRGIMYGNMISYHQMCRFYSGLFYKHELVRNYEWYWRIEPDVEFFCDLSYDPFFEMAKHNKKYGFTIFIKELYWTVPNLFRITKSFLSENNLQPTKLWNLFINDYHIIEGNEYLNTLINSNDDIYDEVEKELQITSLSDRDEGLSKYAKEIIYRSMRKTPIIEDKFDDEEYNLYHFWSNFEIAKLDVFDNEIYEKYFQYLENSGGFWSERWGDAPVHSLGLALTLEPEELHYFSDIGYQHSVIGHCPKNKLNKQLTYKGNPSYNEIFESVSEPKYQSFWKANKPWDEEKSYGIGCRCKCPNIKDVEDTSTECLIKWFDLTSHSYKPPSPIPFSGIKEELSKKIQFS